MKYGSLVESVVNATKAATIGLDENDRMSFLRLGTSKSSILINFTGEYIIAAIISNVQCGGVDQQAHSSSSIDSLFVCFETFRLCI